MRRPKWDKRSELAVKYCCHGSVHRPRLPARKPGPVKLLCRENLALSTALFSMISPSKAQL